MPIEQRDFDQLMNQARTELVGSSESGLKSTLFEVLNEFFNDSQCWHEDIQFTALPALPPPAVNVQFYTLTASEGTVRELIRVWDNQLFSVTALMPDPPNVLIVHPANSPANPYTAKVVKTVALPTDAKGLPIAPHWLLPLYRAHILDGLLGRMMQQPNKSYSNDTKSEYHLKRFRQGIHLAQVAKQHANTVGAQAWAYPQNFRTSGQKGGVSTSWPTGWGR